jgi:hypothetical protein
MRRQPCDSCITTARMSSFGMLDIFDSSLMLSLITIVSFLSLFQPQPLVSQDFCIIGRLVVLHKSDICIII